MPLQSGEIALVSESLTIGASARVGDELKSAGLMARAEYILRNTGPRVRIGYAVPVLIPSDGAGSAYGGKELAEFAKNIKIAVDGREVQCTMSVGEDNGISGLDSWCKAVIDIQHGDAIRLVLEHPLVRNGGIGYPLWPAGYWSGPVERVSIRVDVGASGDDVEVVSPPGARLEGKGVFAWDFVNVDLKKLGNVLVRYVEAGIGRQRGGWIRMPAAVSASASSTLRPEGRFSYQSANAVDGDPATAWCEGASGDGVGESVKVEVKYQPPSGWMCKILDFAVMPGFARDAGAYVANGRVNRARIESCSQPDKGLDVELIRRSPLVSVSNRVVKTDWNPEQAGKVPVSIRPGIDELGGVHECVRFVILGVIPGAKYHDTCISEFTPRLYCRKTGPADAAEEGGASDPVSPEAKRK